MSEFRCATTGCHHPVIGLYSWHFFFFRTPDRNVRVPFCAACARDDLWPRISPAVTIGLCYFAVDPLPGKVSGIPSS